MSVIPCLGAMIVATGAVAILSNRTARSRRRHGQQVTVIGDVTCQIVVNGVGAVPCWGETELVNSGASLLPGGTALNTAVWMHALSTKLKVRILDTTGHKDVLFRSTVLDAVYGSGVKLVKPLGADCSWETGSIVSLTNEEGGKAHVRFPGGNGLFTLDDFNFESLVPRGTVHIHVGGFFNCAGLNSDEILSFLKRSRKNGVRTLSFNPQMSAGIRTSLFRVVREVVGLVDFFICNELEAMTLASGAMDLVAAIMEIATTCRCVVVTLGSEGALLMRQCVDLRPLRILCKDVLETPLIDAIGVGDAFGAGFLHEVVSKSLTPESPEIVEAVRYGCACGTAACTVLGGSTFPGLDMVRACLID